MGKSIVTKINSTPFENIGKGEQATLKIELSLTNPKAESRDNITRRAWKSFNLFKIK